MTVEINLSSVGANVGSLDLYSNVDNYLIPFESGVTAAQLLAGHTSTTVPENTTIIKLKNVGGLCLTSVNILVTSTTTTTSSTTTSTTTTTTTLANSVPCDAIANSGGAGVTEFNIGLDPNGGIIIMDINAQGVPDKLEILHNNVRKATTGMTVANSGPFDILYGDPTIPTGSQANGVDQFIGSAKGTPPNRHAEFIADTGITSVTGTLQQLVWWEYTPSDHTANPIAIVRITGYTGTAWSIQRICVP